jgi:hypothetical protein
VPGTDLTRAWHVPDTNCRSADTYEGIAVWLR